jgi:hypothetical protein
MMIDIAMYVTKRMILIMNTSRIYIRSIYLYIFLHNYDTIVFTIVHDDVTAKERRVLFENKFLLFANYIFQIIYLH